MKKTFLILLLGSALSLSAQSTGQFSNGKTYNISGKELSTKTAMPDDSIDEEDFEKQYARVENGKLYLTIESYNKKPEGGDLRHVFNYTINLKDANLEIGGVEKWSNDDIYKIQLSAKNKDANYFSGEYNKDGFVMNMGNAYLPIFIKTEAAAKALYAQLKK